jgi:hypothetical protein
MHGECPEREGLNRKSAGVLCSSLKVKLSCIQELSALLIICYGLTVM